jgi:cytochrome subunit of sulfide dehydrogenase
MGRHRALIMAAAALVATAVSAQESDSTLGRNIAAGCAGCHGTGGKSAGSVPSLAGAGKAELVAKMQEFKNGKRTGTIMPQLAKGYTDEQIELAAQWFAAQPSPSK